MVSYSEVTVTGYNSSPPPDDGSTGASNQVSWAGIKTKLSDPLKTAIEAIDDNVATAVAALDAIDTSLSSSISSEASTRAAADSANLATVQANLYAPSGTIMSFRQTSAPTGWTKDSSNYNNHALRVTTGTPSAYSSGYGVSAVWQQSAWGTSSTSITATYGAYHRHYATVTGTSGGASAYAHTHNYVTAQVTTATASGTGNGYFRTPVSTASASGGVNHTHYTVSGGYTNYQNSQNAHSHTVDRRINYVDIIFATKA